MTVEDSGQGVSGGEGAQGTNEGLSTGGMNPAWNEALGSIPQEYHSQLIPHLQKWDKGVNERFQQVHSQYEGYKPFVDNQITPDEINFAMGLLNAVNTDPHSVVQAINAWTEQEGIEAPGGVAPSNLQTGEQGQQQPQIDLNQIPEYQQMSQAVQEMARLMVSQREQEQQAQEDARLDKELSDLRAQHGDFDEQFVVSQMAAGKSGEEAVQAFQSMVQQILSGQRQPGPKVLGSGGSLPQNNVDVRKMDSKETRSLVADMLRQASQQQ